MTDLFDDNFGAPTEVAAPEPAVAAFDPAAEFLAQQEDEIADLENEAAENIEIVTNGVEELAVDNAATDDFFGGPVATEEPTVLVEDVVENGIEDFQEMEEVMDPSQAYAAIAAADARIEELRSEPEKIRIWREENTKRLAEKDAESEEKRQEWLAQAKKELEDWEKNRLEQLEKTKESNRTAEEQFIKERDQSTPGSEWERVSKLCDFNPKGAKGTKDVTRMRSSLLQLKQNPRSVRTEQVAAASN